MASFSEGALANFFFGDKESAAGGLVGVLGPVGHQSGVTLLDKGRDIDDKTWSNVRVEAGIYDLEGAMRRIPGVDFGDAREKAGIVTQVRGDGVIRMARLPIRKNDDTWTEMAQDAHDFNSVVERVFDRAIGNVESLSRRDAEETSSFSGFLGAIGGAAARSGFALREVEDSGAESAGCHAQQRAATGLFDVVAVSGDGQHVGDGVGTHE